VIGGGIAGPVMAMALQKAGVDATIYEAYPHRAEGVGGGLSIAPNGLNALDVIDASHAIRPTGKPMTGIVLQDWAGRRLGEFGNPPGVPPMQYFWRADLYQAIYDEAEGRGIRTEYGKRIVKAEEHPDGITAHFVDGTQATADVLIGADGIRSTVRTLIDPGAPGPSYAGLISFGSRVHDPGVPQTGGKMNMSFGKRAFFGYQVFDAQDAVWFANLPSGESMSAAEARRTPAIEWLSRLADVFAGDRTPARELIRRTDPDDLVTIGSMENMPPHVPSWSKGRMVLVGDSAHAPSSSSGQGASLAIESAIELARCLRDLPYDQAFDVYESLRRPRVERIIKETTRKNSDKTAGPIGRTINGLALRVFSKLVKPEKSAWMFDHEFDWDAKACGGRSGPAPSAGGVR
jgi:2-polyprenyl-6-methoxyphenol hydroxylase-like FAD-dependent oxidoreductase